MPAEEIIKEARDLKEGYVLLSPLTNLPYMECEEEEFNDQVYLYADQAEAEAAVEAFKENDIRVVMHRLQTVEVQLPAKAGEAPKKTYLNQLHQHFGILSYIGCNAVVYKPAGKEAQTIWLDDLLPEGFEEKVDKNAFYQPTLQLTGLYLMQEARKHKEKVDRKHLQELDEEFSANLAKSHLFLSVLPPKGHEKDEKLDLKECQMPYLRHQNGEIYFPLFTDVWEFQKYARGKQGLRLMQMPFQAVQNFWVKDAKAYMINPMGFAIPLTKELIPKLLERFGTANS